MREPDPNEPKPRGYVTAHDDAKPFDDGHLVLQRNIRLPFSPSTGQSPPSPGSPAHKATYSIEFNLKAINPVPPSAHICDADDSTNCVDLPIGTVMGGGGSPDSVVITYDLSGINLSAHPSGSRRLLCFTGISKPLTLSNTEWHKHYHQRFCRQVSIDENMFQDFPYTYVSRQPGARFAVFPVVGPDLKQSVSLVNRSWDAKKAEVAIWDPASAVRQAYYEFLFNQCPDTHNPTNPCDLEAIRNRNHFVVLAQMSNVAAKQLANRLLDSNVKLAVVISKAETKSSSYGKDIDYLSAGEKIAIIGTNSIYTPDQNCPGDTSKLLGATLKDPLHLISSRPSAGTLSHIKTPGTGWCVAKPAIPSPDEKKAWAARANPTGQYAQMTALQDPTAQTIAQEVQKAAPFVLDDLLDKNGIAPDLEHLIAEQMREHYFGDAGLISTHEIFRDTKVTDPKDLVEKTERAIWEGAHITTVRLSGKKLRAVLDARKDAPADHSLIFSGIVPNDNKDYYINGKPLLDTSYYTVIAPDALVYGDPSYTALADNTFQDPDVHDATVTGLVCDVIRSIPNNNFNSKPDCIESQNITPEANSLASWDPPSTIHLRSYLLSIFAPDQHNPLVNLSTSSKADDRRQNDIQYRLLWFASLLKNNLSYALNKPDTSDANLGGHFGAITDPRVSQAHKENYSVDNDLRLGLNWRSISTGIEEIIQFGRTRQGNTDGSRDAVSLTSNTGTVGPFFEWVFLPNIAPSFRMILRPADFTDNFARTKSFISGKALTQTSLSSFLEDLPVRRTWANKGGLRYEVPQRKDSLFAADGKSFIEIGYQSTLNINAPTELTLNPGTANQKICSLESATETLKDCAKPVSVVNPTAFISGFRSNRQNGAYWSFLFGFPILKRLTYKTGSDGEFRFADNISSERRYAVTFDNFLQTRLIGNLGLAPHMGWFFYENQHDHNNLIRRIYDVTLTYNFDWHRGMGWRTFFMKPETAAK